MLLAVQQSSDVIEGVKGAVRRQELSKHVAKAVKNR